MCCVMRPQGRPNKLSNGNFKKGRHHTTHSRSCAQPWAHLWKLLRINRDKGAVYTLTRQNRHRIDNPASAAKARIDWACREE